MAWRGSHYVAAGLLAGGALLWASADAWPWRRPLMAPPIVVSQAYVDFADTLGKRETLSAVLARGGIVGRDYTGLLAAARGLDVRRLRPGLVRSEEHTSELQSLAYLVCRLLLEKK